MNNKKNGIADAFAQLRELMSGWNDLIDKQTEQLPEIYALYGKHGLNIDRTSLACPEQYDVTNEKGEMVAYLRLRYGDFTVDYPDCWGVEIYSAEPIGDGIFEESERIKYMTEALNAILNHITPHTP